MRLFQHSRKTSRKGMVVYKINFLSVVRNNFKDWAENNND